MLHALQKRSDVQVWQRRIRGVVLRLRYALSNGCAIEFSELHTTQATPDGATSDDRRLADLHEKLRRCEVALEHCKKDLAVKSLHMLRIQHTLLRIKAELRRAIAEQRAGRIYDVTEAHDLLASALDDNSSWQTFEQQYHLIDQDFLSMLTQRFPQLLSAELKVCALVKLGLSAKEISQVLNVTERTVGEYRYRIRKKLDLSRNDQLQTFLTQL